MITVKKSIAHSVRDWWASMRYVRTYVDLYVLKCGTDVPCPLFFSLHLFATRRLYLMPIFVIIVCLVCEVRTRGERGRVLERERGIEKKIVTYALRLHPLLDLEYHTYIYMPIEV